MASNPESSLFFDSDTLKKINESALISQTHSTGSFWPISDYGHRLYWVVFCPVMYANHASQS